MNLRLLLPLAFLAFVAIAAAACGGGDDDSNPFGPSGGDNADSAEDDGDGNSFGGGNAEDNCTFRVELSGLVDQKIRWNNGCQGIGNDGTMELIFTDDTKSDGLLFIISVSGIEKGKTGTDSGVTLSILGTVDEDTIIFHGTEAGDCTVEVTRHKKLESTLGASIYAVTGRLTCTEPVGGAFGESEAINLSDVEFEAPVAWIG